MPTLVSIASSCANPFLTDQLHPFLRLQLHKSNTAHTVFYCSSLNSYTINSVLNTCRPLSLHESSASYHPLPTIPLFHAFPLASGALLPSLIYAAVVNGFLLITQQCVIKACSKGNQSSGFSRSFTKQCLSHCILH